MRDRNAVNEHIELPNIYKMKLKSKIVNRLKKIRIFRGIKNNLESIVTLLRGLISITHIYVYGTREKRSAHACLPCFRGRKFAIEIIRDNKAN